MPEAELNIVGRSIGDKFQHIRVWVSSKSFLEPPRQAGARHPVLDSRTCSPSPARSPQSGLEVLSVAGHCQSRTGEIDEHSWHPKCSWREDHSHYWHDGLDLLSPVSG